MGFLIHNVKVLSWNVSGDLFLSQTSMLKTLLRVNMAARFIVMITTMWIFNCNVWFVFSIWHSVRLRQVGNRRL